MSQCNYWSQSVNAWFKIQFFLQRPLKYGWKFVCLVKSINCTCFLLLLLHFLLRIHKTTSNTRSRIQFWNKLKFRVSSKKHLFHNILNPCSLKFFRKCIYIGIIHLYQCFSTGVPQHTSVPWIIFSEPLIDVKREGFVTLLYYIKCITIWQRGEISIVVTSFTLWKLINQPDYWGWKNVFETTS